jgi:hypothetical protein
MFGGGYSNISVKGEKCKYGFVVKVGSEISG